MAKIETTESRREARARRLAEMEANPEDPRHGTITGYRYGCRCRKCLEGHLAYNLGVGGRSKAAERRWREKVARESGTPSLERLMESAGPAVVEVHGVGKVMI